MIFLGVYLPLALAVFVGGCAYRAARRFEADFGRSAYGLPRFAWAVICFITVFGLLLLWNARRQQSKTAGSDEPAVSSPAFRSPRTKGVLLTTLAVFASLFIGLITWAQLSGPPK